MHGDNYEGQVGRVASHNVTSLLHRSAEKLVSISCILQIGQSQKLGGGWGQNMCEVMVQGDVKFDDGSWYFWTGLIASEHALSHQKAPTAYFLQVLDQARSLWQVV